MKEWPELTGLTFGQIMYRFETAVPIGILRKAKLVNEGHGEECKGEMILNPNVELVLEEGDSVVVISEDDDTYSASKSCLFRSKCIGATATVGVGNAGYGSHDCQNITMCCDHAMKLSLCESIGSPYKPREKFREKLLFIG
jgi:hypothetical protein